MATLASAPPKPPSPQCVSWLVFAAAAQLAPRDRAYIADVCALCPSLARARDLAYAFRRMLRNRGAAAFLPWLAAAHRSALGLTTGEQFVRGLRYDAEAVYTGVALPWSWG